MKRIGIILLTCFTIFMFSNSAVCEENGIVPDTKEAAFPSEIAFTIPEDEHDLSEMKSVTESKSEPDLENKVISYTVIIKDDGNKFSDSFSRDTVQEFLSAIGFFYPEYEQVKMNVYISKGKFPHQYALLISGIISEHWTDLLPVSYVFDELPQVDIEEKLLNEKRVLLIGDFEYLELERIAQKCKKEDQDMVFFRNSTVYWSDETNIYWPEEIKKRIERRIFTNPLSEADYLYKKYAGNYYPQAIDIIETNNNWAMISDPYALHDAYRVMSCRAIISNYDKNPTKLTETAILFPDMTIYSFQTGQESIKLELENDGESRTIITNICYYPFFPHFVYDDQKTYGVRDQAEISVMIEAVKDDYVFSAQEWRAEVQHLDTPDTKQEMIWDDNGFTSKLCFDEYGTHDVDFIIHLWNETFTGFDWKKVITLHVNNNPPQKSNAEDIEQVYFFKVKEKPESQSEWDISSFFTDDAGKESLTYTLDPKEVPGVAIEGARISAEPENFESDEVHFKVYATDKGKAQSEPLSFSFRRVWMDQCFAGGTVTVSSPESVKKGETISVSAELRFPETADEYLHKLTDEQKNDLMKDILAKIVIDGDREDVKGDYSASSKKFEFKVEKNALETGAHIAEVIFSYGETKVASEQFDIHVENRLPQFIKKGDEIQITIPGPLFLHQNIKCEQQTINLREYVETEPLDEITIKIYGDKDFFITEQEDGTCLITDDDKGEKEKNIVWDTTDPEAKPVIAVTKSKLGTSKFTIEVRDQDGAVPEGDPLSFTFIAKYQNQDLYLKIAIGAAAALLLTALILILRNILKPSFKQGEKLFVAYRNTEKEVSLELWGKEGISASNILIYSCVPVWDILPDGLEKVILKAGKEANSAILCNAKNNGIVVKKYNVIQTGNNISFESGEVVDIYLNSQDYFSIRIE